jgi:hypothetical protein
MPTAITPRRTPDATWPSLAPAARPPEWDGRSLPGAPAFTVLRDTVASALAATRNPATRSRHHHAMGLPARHQDPAGRPLRLPVATPSRRDHQARLRAGGLAWPARPEFTTSCWRSGPTSLKLSMRIPFGRLYEQAAGEPTYKMLPLFSVDEAGRVSSSNSPTLIEQSQFLEDAPRLTVAQKEVLKAVEEIALRPDVAFHFLMQRGDLSLINNHRVLHSVRGLRRGGPAPVPDANLAGC